MFSKRKKEGPSSLGLFVGFPPSFEKRDRKERKRQKKTERMEKKEEGIKKKH